MLELERPIDNKTFHLIEFVFRYLFLFYIFIHASLFYITVQASIDFPSALNNIFISLIQSLDK